MAKRIKSIENVLQIEPIYEEIYRHPEIRALIEIVCEAGPIAGLYSACWHIQDFEIPKPNNTYM